MTGFQPWKRRPLFVSSTFRDMQAERDHLQRVVFPRLEEALKSRRHHLETIDLRWGISTTSLVEQHEKELQILRVCLADIERCRPFLLVCLGNRYGWEPPTERLRAIAHEHGFEGPLEGKSITALEIEFGVSGLPREQVRAHFFFRQLDDSGMEDPERSDFLESDHHAASKLAELKQRLRREFPGRVLDYEARWDPTTRSVQGLEAFGDQVFQQLWADLDAETLAYAQQPAPSWQEQERQTLETFVADKTRDFCGREALSDELVNFAFSPSGAETPWGTCLVSATGTGKSSLFAHLFQQLQGRLHDGKEPLLLAHSAGNSPHASSAHRMLLRWSHDLAAALQAEPPPDDAAPPVVQRYFEGMLTRVARSRRVVLLLDAVDQLDVKLRPGSLDWLPEPWPPNARLIALTRPGEMCDALVRRPGVRSRPLAPMSLHDAKQLIERICDRHHRTPGERVIDVLLNRRAEDGSLSCGTPLWLQLATEELNLLDAEDFTRFQALPAMPAEGEDQRLERMLLWTAENLAPTVVGLYAWILERSEETLGTAFARGFANLMSLSRTGLRESDLQQLLPAVTGQPWDPLKFATLRRVFRAHLVQRGPEGVWDFVHSPLRLAIARRNLGDDMLVQQFHGTIAAHLAKLPTDDLLRQSELMYHLIGAGNRLLTAEHYAWLRCPTSLPDSPEQPLHARQRDVVLEMGSATQAIADYLLCNTLLDASRGAPMGMHEQRLDWVLSWLITADELFKDSPDGYTRAVQVGFTPKLLLAHFGVHLYPLLEERGAPLDALQKLANRIQRAATLVENSPDFIQDAVFPGQAYARVGDAAMQRRDVPAALQAYLRADALFERTYAFLPDDVEARRNLAVSREKLGDAFAAGGDIAQSLDCYQSSRELREHLDSDGKLEPWPAFHRDLTVIHSRIGGVLRWRGDPSGALACYRKALAAAQRFESNPAVLPDIRMCHELIGQMLLQLDRPEEACKAFEDSLEYTQRLMRREPANPFWPLTFVQCQQQIGHLRLAMNDAPAALAAFLQAVARLEQEVELSPAEVDWRQNLCLALCTVARLQADLGQLPEAGDCLRRCHTLLVALHEEGVELEPRLERMLAFLKD